MHYHNGTQRVVRATWGRELADKRCEAGIWAGAVFRQAAALTEGTRDGRIGGNLGGGPHSDMLRRSMKGHAMSGGERPGKRCEAGIWAGFCGDEVSVRSKSKVSHVPWSTAQDLTLTGRGRRGGGDIAGLHDFIPNRDARWRHLDWDTSTTMVPCGSQLCLIEMRGGPPALGALLGSLTMTRSRRATAAPASPAAPDPPPGRCTRSSKPTPPTPLVPSTTRKPSKKGKKEPKKKKQKKTPPPLEKPQIEEPAQELPQDDNTRQTVVEAAAAQDLDLSQEEEQDENALQTVVEAAAAQDLDLSQEEEQDENALQTVVQVTAAQDLDLPPDEDEGNVETVHAGSQDSDSDTDTDLPQDEDIVKAELTVLQDAASAVPRGAANTFANLRFTHHLNARQLKANLLPGPRLSRDLPTFKINNVLPFPSPETEVHYKANLQAVYYQAAAAVRPMVEYWGEIHLEHVFVEACQEDASFLARHFEHAKVAFRAGLGPRANRYLDVEAVEGGSLWLEVKPTGAIIPRGPGIRGLRDAVVRDRVHDYRVGLGPRANSYLDTHAIASGSMWLRVTADLRVAPAGADLTGFEAAIAADEAAALDSSVLATSVDGDAPDDAPDYSTRATSVASSNDSMPTLMSAITTVAATPDAGYQPTFIPLASTRGRGVNGSNRRNIRANVLEWALNVSGTGEADEESTHNTI
ncbi:hypothetical protein C8R44DRAFT_746311 [Mycena epipterygia]|nr:hypothetical protein C8R44DRAFT_746311 [Mycena epipterygia]